MKENKVIGHNFDFQGKTIRHARLVDCEIVGGNNSDEGGGSISDFVDALVENTRFTFSLDDALAPFVPEADDDNHVMFLVPKEDINPDVLKLYMAGQIPMVSVQVEDVIALFKTDCFDPFFGEDEGDMVAYEPSDGSGQILIIDPENDMQLENFNGGLVFIIAGFAPPTPSDPSNLNSVSIF